MTLGAAVLDLLFPPRCPFCDRIQSATGVCPACEKDLPWIGEERQTETLPGNLRCAAPLWYEGAVRAALLRLKFQGERALAGELGGLLAACAAARFSGEFDAVAWVPVSKKRLRKRGYDQARLLAEAACRRWGVRPEPLLTKPTDNPPQSGLSDPAARRANVLGVYEANGGSAAGRRVLLVDDILTTGATAVECARTLRAAGAADVVCVALARTRPKTGGPPPPGRAT